MERLDEETLRAAAEELAARDGRLAAVVAAHGSPPLWAREPGFPTLLHIILEQQVSLASARAAFDRLRAAADPLTPARFLDFDDAELKAIGFSRQKTRYGRELSRAVLTGALDLDGLREQDDDSARTALTSVTGIGRWSSDIYLLMALGRPDVWPAGDLALEVAARDVLALPQKPGRDELAVIAETWRPYRAVAARILWHAYLSRRNARGA
ncbi:MAG: DNA-3-methyladenine glycosylase 2 family protein [Anaerolineae bacterium]|nr:DNA-3-methyladenine glycosylase 2 family protein [Anaerolineae bacterium]